MISNSEKGSFKLFTYSLFAIMWHLEAMGSLHMNLSQNWTRLGYHTFYSGELEKKQQFSIHALTLVSLILPFFRQEEKRVTKDGRGCLSFRKDTRPSLPFHHSRLKSPGSWPHILTQVMHTHAVIETWSLNYRKLFISHV